MQEIFSIEIKSTLPSPLPSKSDSPLSTNRCVVRKCVGGEGGRGGRDLRSPSVHTHLGLNKGLQKMNQSVSEWLLRPWKDLGPLIRHNESTGSPDI